MLKYVPLAQTELTIKEFLKARGYYEAKFELEEDKPLHIIAGPIYKVKDVVFSGAPEDFNDVKLSVGKIKISPLENTQSVMTKKSIGFFSFFILSSTPVEIVNYDSVTGQYSARVKLPSGFTGTVGSDWDKAQEVGIRRRLGGKRFISAGFGTDAKGESRKESMIEWFHRY